MKKISYVCCLCTLVGGSGVAHAELGAAGTKAILGDVNLDAGWETTNPPEAEPYTRKTIALHGSYFVADNVSIGAGVEVQHDARDDLDLTALSATLSGGYVTRLGENLHLWPQLSHELARATFTFGSSEGTANRTDVSLYVPFVLEPAEHFLLGIGPVVSKSIQSSVATDGDSSDGSDFTTVAVVATIGGWF